MTLSRRKFIGSLVVAGSTLTAGGLFLKITDEEGNEKELLLKLNQFLSEPSAANEIGKAYLAANPNEKDPSTLLHAIYPEIPKWISFQDTLSLHESFREMVKADFTEGRTTKVKGWILSVTEARYCALMSLST